MEEISRIPSEVLIPREKIAQSSAAPSWTAFLPAILAFVGAFLVFFLRMNVTGESFISDSALMMLALACYILAGLLLLTNLYAPSEMAQKIGLWGATLGVFFNLSSWLVRWIAAYDLERVKLLAAGHDQMPWFFRYYPLTNLYDYSLAFAFGAVFATLLIGNRKKFQFLAAFTLPLAALILTLARFIGGEFVELPPVLDSYWRPIHVTVASMSYGMAMVCFAVAVVYLLKDKAKVEAMAIWTSIFALSVMATISKFSVFTEFVYRAGTFLPNPNGAKPFNALFRFELPYVGITLVVSGVLLLGVIVSFLLYIYQNNETAKKTGHILLKLAFVAQIVALAFFVSGIKSTTDVYPKLQSQLATNSSQYITVGKALAEGQRLSAQEFAALPAAQLEQSAKQYLQTNGDKFFLSLNTNPVEFAGLITALAGTFFVILFAFRTDKLRERLPSLETGALVAWLTYAAFLHTRISRGWSGRSSAYFAVIGFLLVIFTYLGVSYLLPGLHSYA